MVSLAPEPVFFVGNFGITNTLLHTLFVDAVVVGVALYVSKHIKQIPGKVQNIAEIGITTFYDLTESVAQKNAAKIFPFFMAFFIFILFANWSSLIPGVGSIGFFEGKKLIPVLRGTTSDINTTLALALISAVATHILSIKTIGVKDYLGRYFSFNPMNLFIGILEIISEITKIISLSFRLFAFLLPLPFMFLEIIVGFVQALVFSMLTMTFMAILTTSHESAKEVSHQ